jgi:hypothetical protein
MDHTGKNNIAATATNNAAIPTMVFVTKGTDAFILHP